MELLTERKWTQKDNITYRIYLLKCAHCGGVAEVKTSGMKIRLACHSCGMSTPLVDFQAQAVAIWNKRTL